MSSKDSILSKARNKALDKFEINRVDSSKFIVDYSDDLVEEYIKRATENKAIVIKTDKKI